MGAFQHCQDLLPLNSFGRHGPCCGTEYMNGFHLELRKGIGCDLGKMTFRQGFLLVVRRKENGSSSSVLHYKADKFAWVCHVLDGI